MWMDENNKNITLEQSLQAYRVMNTPTEYSWKQHYVTEKFSNPDVLLLTQEEREQYYKRLLECQITICDNIQMREGHVCTLKDMLHIVVSPENKEIEKQFKKVIYSSSNGERPIGRRAYEIWNGFQLIDLDMKKESPELIQRIKNHIFQKLYKCNWFLGIGFSASGKGLHVWTKITVPEGLTDMNKRKLHFLTNFRHKYSYVYLACISACELFGFPKEKVLQWIDLALAKPQQGAYIGYDSHPLINSGFFEDFIYVNFDNVEEIGHPDIDWVTYPELKEVFKRWDWFEKEDNNIDISVKDAPELEVDIHNKVHYKHFERWRLANTLVKIYGEDLGYKYLRLICSNNIKDMELRADCQTAARHSKPIDPWAVQRLNTQHGFKIKLNIQDDSFDESRIFSSMDQIENPTLIKESSTVVNLHLNSNQYLGDIRKDILGSLGRLTLLEAGPGLGKTEMVKLLVNSGLKIVMVMPFTSVIKSKVENDPKWYFSYGNRQPRLDMTPGVAMTIDKFSRLNLMDIKTAGFDYIFIDESHLMFLSEYRPVMSKVIDLIKTSEVPVVMMSGTPCGELVFFPDATHIKIVKDDSRIKEFKVNIVDTPSDLIFHMCKRMALDIVDGRRVLFPTNNGTLYSKQVEAAVNYFLRNDHQWFDPVKLHYYKKSNDGEKFMDDVNFEKTIKDTQILLCSNYMSVGTDVLDKYKFSIYFAELILPHEIDQFCNRLRNNDLYANLYISKVNGEGNPRNLHRFKPLNFKLNEEEIKDVHAILRLCNSMIERNPVEYKYNSLISSIINSNKFIEYNNVENKYYLNQTSYLTLEFERKYREYAQQLPVVMKGMQAYGYRVNSVDLKSFILEDALFSNLKDMVRLAYDEGLELNTRHIEELMELITEDRLKIYKDVLAGRYEIKKGDVWKEDLGKNKMIVKNIEVFEKVVPIFISLSKQYEMSQIKEIFNYCRHSGGSFNFAAIGRIRMLVNIVYNEKRDRLDIPIKEYMNEVYKFSENKTCTQSELEAFIRNFSTRYAQDASTDDIVISLAELSMKKIIDAFTKIFKCLIKVSRPKKGKILSLERVELLWREREAVGKDGETENVYVIDEFLGMID